MNVKTPTFSPPSLRSLCQTGSPPPPGTRTGRSSADRRARASAPTPTCRTSGRPRTTWHGKPTCRDGVGRRRSSGATAFSSPPSSTPAPIRTAEEGALSGGDRREPPKAEHQWKVFGLDLETGKVQWERRLIRACRKPPFIAKQLRRGDARVRWRAGLCFVRQRRGVRLHARRRGGLVEAPRAAR